MRRFDVTIAGELNLDLILYGTPDEIPRERELLVSDLNVTLGSSSAIVAHNLASLGSRVGFVSCIGDDQFGELALARLAAAGADVSKVAILPGRKTGLTVIMQRDSWRNMLTYAGTIFDLQMKNIDLEYLSSAKHFHLSSYYLQRGLQADVPELFKKLKSAGLTISFDCNDDPDDGWDGGIREALKYVDVLLPNAREAMRLTGAVNAHAAAEQLARVVPLVAIKLGAEGAIARKGNERWASPALKVEAVDPVGAGDSFDAGFLHEYLRGSGIESCLAAGNRAGALSVTRAGGTEAFRDAVHREQFLREHAG
ncbi:MAG TPA: carbohydrate kinase family protein [Terriglobales bacterium]|jgi:sugar/nucleoside kinase (ribokinase family)